MSKLSFALYGSQSQFIESIAPILQAFEKKTGSTIETTGMSVDDAWQKLLQYSIHGGGPDLARIGAIWTSSLVSLNALRPFKVQEVNALGGKDVFLKPMWQSATLPGEERVWAIPFTSYNYIFFYRKDLFDKAGVAIDKAFSSAEEMSETLEKLQGAGIQSPWVIPTGEHFRARLHILASWIWGAGGHFLSEDGKQILLNQPAALEGLEKFYNLHRYLASGDYGLSLIECRRRFARGQTAAFIGGPDTLHLIRESNPTPGVIENISAAALPGTPWIGGSSLVVWKDVLMDPPKERLVNNLITLLTSKTTQEQLFNLSNFLPARADALLELKLDPPELLEVEKLIMQSARSYRPYPIWVRIQNDLTRILDNITAEFLEDTSRPVLPIIKKHINPLVKRYNLILSAM